MAGQSRSQKRESTPGWLASLVGAIFLVSAGFMLGLVVGIVKDEPELVMNHMAGNGEEVAWSDHPSEFSSGDPGESEASQRSPAYIPTGQGKGWPALESELEAVPGGADQVATQYPPVDLRPPQASPAEASPEV